MKPDCPDAAPEPSQVSDINTARDRGDVRLLGQRTLRTSHVVAQALAIGPIASVSLVGYLVGAEAGSAAPLVALIAMGGALCLGWTVSLYARRYAGAGAVYEYVALTQGKTLGVVTAGLVLATALLVGSPLIFVFTGLLVEGFTEAHLGFDVAWWTGGAAAALLVFALVYLGVRLSVTAQLVLTALSALPFVIFAVATIASGGESGNTLRVFSASAPGHGDVLPALLLATLLFGGFEAAAALGEEARLPTRSIPRSILLTITLAGLFYLLMIYAATIGFGPDAAVQGWSQGPGALSALADRYVGSPTGTLMELAVIIDLVAVAVALANAVSRLAFVLARDRLLPACLAAVSRHETPVGGLALVTTANFLGLAAAVPFREKFDLIALLAVAAALPPVFTYVVLSLGATRFLREKPGIPWRWAVLVAGLATPLLGGYGTLVPFPTGLPRWGVWLAVGLLLVNFAWVAYLRACRQDELRQAASYALVSVDTVG